MTSLWALGFGQLDARHSELVTIGEDILIAESVDPAKMKEIERYRFPQGKAGISLKKRVSRNRRHKNNKQGEYYHTPCCESP